MTIDQMQERFNAYDAEWRAFTFSPEWLTMTWQERWAREDEIDRKHFYQHGWIVVDGVSFDRYQAFPNEVFANVWD